MRDLWVYLSPFPWMIDLQVCLHSPSVAKLFLESSKTCPKNEAHPPQITFSH